ncbi:MAG TPA: secretion system protein [Propionibacteriaceae bacterium]|nr:secretion system protein [Propionibacteriaceae bacterium]
MIAVVIAALSSGLAVLAAWPPTASRLLTTADSGVEAPRTQRRSAMALVTGVAAALATVVSGWWSLVIGAFAAVVAAVVLRAGDRAALARRQEKLRAALPQTCDLLVVCLEAGLPARGAAATVARAVPEPMAAVLAETVAKTELGVDEYRAWQDLAADTALAGLGRELGRGAATGMSLSARLRVLAADTRKARAAEAETRAKRVGVRSVLPLMLCFLPAFVLLGLVPILGGMLGGLFG